MILPGYGRKIWLSHRPQPQRKRQDKGARHLQGHVHGKTKRRDLSHYGGAECWEYHPITSEENESAVGLSP